jgi:hypothetical protein
MRTDDDPNDHGKEDEDCKEPVQPTKTFKNRGCDEGTVSGRTPSRAQETPIAY